MYNHHLVRALLLRGKDEVKPIGHLGQIEPFSNDFIDAFYPRDLFDSSLLTFYQENHTITNSLLCNDQRQFKFNTGLTDPKLPRFLAFISKTDTSLAPISTGSDR